MGCLHDKQEKDWGHVDTLLHPCVIADVVFFFACLELYLTVDIEFLEHVDEWKGHAIFLYFKKEIVFDRIKSLDETNEESIRFFAMLSC